MNINQNCSLILRDLYSYDVKSCYPTVLSKQFFDFDGVDLNDKQQRSEFIGKKQIGNENLSSFLMTSADSIVKFYLNTNNVDESNIIVTQRDGFILSKSISNTDEFISMELRDLIDFMIISIDRKKYLVSVQGEVTAKGIPHLYPEMEKIYQLFSNLNFYNKSNLFEQMQFIKESIISSTNRKLFSIPREERKYAMILHKENIETSDPDMISIEKINKMFYFQHYIKPFLDSIFMETY